MVELRSKKSYDAGNTTSSGASSDHSKPVTRKTSRSTKPVAAIATISRDLHPSAEVTSPTRRSSRLRNRSDDEATVEDQGRMDEERQQLKVPAPSPAKAKPAAAPSSTVDQAKEEAPVPQQKLKGREVAKQTQQPTAVVAPPSPHRGSPAFSFAKAAVVALLAMLLGVSVFIATRPDLQQQIQVQVNRAFDVAQAKLQQLPDELRTLRAELQASISERILQARELVDSMLNKGSKPLAEPIFQAELLAAAVHSEQVWQARATDVLAHVTPVEAPKALGLLLTGSSAEACSAAAAAVAAAASQQRCVLHLHGADFPADDEEAAGRLQVQLADFFGGGCPAGLVLLEGLPELSSTSVNVLHNALSEQGSLVHMGRQVRTTSGAVVVVLQADIPQHMLLDEQQFEVAARVMLAKELEQKLEHLHNAPGVVDAAVRGFLRRIDYVLPAAE